MAAAEDLLYLPEWSLEGLREVTETARRFREFSRVIKLTAGVVVFS
jgi:hypothetical protein